VPGSFFVRSTRALRHRVKPSAMRLQIDQLRVFDGDEDRHHFGVWVNFLQGRLISLHLAGITIDEVARGGDGIGFVIDDFNACDAA